MSPFHFNYIISRNAFKFENVRWKIFQPELFK
uniref:Uncharacterized protein n=1 Tax=Anguilla anguilla TaxID=7936 RepID=A0A0E9SKG2_ANGAN